MNQAEVEAAIASLGQQGSSTKRSVTLAQVKTLIQNASGGSTGNIVFLDAAVTIENASTSTVAWTTYSAAASIPDGYTIAILEIKGGNDSTGSQWVLARRESGAQEYMIHRCRGGGGAADDVASACQALVPLTSSKTFDYTIVEGYSYDCTIKLIGYTK